MLAVIFALLLGIGFTAAGWSYVALARRMRHFRCVPGKVIAREVVRDPSSSTVTGVYGNGGGYLPYVKYRYAVDGADLVGDKISFAYSPYKHAYAEKKLAEIPDDVVVWYNPEKPGEAFLKKHTSTIGVIILIFSSIWELCWLIALAVKLTGA